MLPCGQEVGRAGAGQHLGLPWGAAGTMDVRSCAGRGAKAVESRLCHEAAQGPSDAHWGTQ